MGKSSCRGVRNAASTTISATIVQGDRVKDLHNASDMLGGGINDPYESSNLIIKEIFMVDISLAELPARAEHHDFNTPIRQKCAKC